METPIYTTPKLKKGKQITHVPKGSSKAKEEAKQMWYIEYFFNGKQVRVKKGLNRIDDHVEKQRRADVMIAALKGELEAGFNPLNPAAYAATTKKEIISLVDAIQVFKEYHTKHNSRKKTIATYLSKLSALSANYPGKLLKDVTTNDLENFVQAKINDGTYAHNSVKSAKRIFGTFFNVMIVERYAVNNPKEGFNKKINSKKVVGDKHTPYSDEDLKRVLDYLDANDKFTAFFCRMVYYTCIRPGEIRGLQLKHIDLRNRKIIIPASIKKNTINQTDDEITIDKNFVKELEKLELNQYPVDYYLTGSTKNIVGITQVGINSAYEKLMTALINIDKKDLMENPELPDAKRIINQGYDLYSFKHKSNINKYLAGWTLAAIMKANRHGSITMTEIYLKKLGIFIEITDDVPAI